VRHLLALLAAAVLGLSGAALAGPPAVAAADVHAFDLYDAGSVRWQQPDNDACVATSALMMLNMVAAEHTGDGAEPLAGFRWTSTTVYSTQEQMLTWARAHDTFLSTPGTDAHGWRNVLNYYGWGSVDAGVYRDAAYADFDDALKATVIGIAKYHLPVGLLMEAGFHAELVSGYRVEGADPATGSTDFSIDGLYLTDPWQRDGHRDDYASYTALRTTGSWPVRFIPYTQTDSPYRDPIDGHIGRDEWYGKYVIVLPVKATAPTPAPTAPKAQPSLGADASQFVALGPTRVLDTRQDVGLSGPLASHDARRLTLAGHHGIPKDATAVAVNATLVDQSAAGYLTLSPVARDDPTTSTLNAPRSDIRANGAIVPLADDGSLSVTYAGPAGAHAEAAVDVTGAFVADKGAGFVALSPRRLLDSRDGTGLSGRFTAGTARKLKVSGVNGVPAHPSAVAVNVTVVGQTAAGYLTLSGTPESDITTSTINFPRGDIRANNAIVPVAADGTIAIEYSAPTGATTQVVLDVGGAFVSGDGLTFTPLAPTRFVDTRANLGLTYDFASGHARRLGVAGVAGVAKGATAVALNLTTVHPSAAGYLAVTATPESTPATSTLNFPSGDVRANGAIASLADGDLGLTYAAVPDTHDDVVLDVVGYFGP
jgi:hypothetical protein